MVQRRGTVEVYSTPSSDIGIPCIENVYYRARTRNRNRKTIE